LAGCGFSGRREGGLQCLFDGLVPTELIEAYDRLLATDGCAKERAESVVGDAERCGRLPSEAWHVQPHSPTALAWLHPASPDLALQGVLAGHQHRLARDHEVDRRVLRNVSSAL